MRAVDFYSDDSTSHSARRCDQINKYKIHYTTEGVRGNRTPSYDENDCADDMKNCKQLNVKHYKSILTIRIFDTKIKVFGNYLHWFPDS